MGDKITHPTGMTVSPPGAVLALLNKFLMEKKQSTAVGASVEIASAKKYHGRFFRESEY